MTAQALYLKYRPQTFDEVAGQDPITRTLRNALRHDKVRHAYLFTGPRGTGKTTTARLLAKAVNCQASIDERPCNKCSTCLAINEGRLLDLIEIDAASNRGIDEIRDIREKVGFRPSEGEYKVYVLDEAHMLTEPAFNALLKTLEEPPPHVIFALVTTDPHKIPATITSRCQRFDFGRIPVQAIVNRLATIASKEGVTVDQEALAFIAHHSTGAMRDAISLLDQLTSYGDEITLDQVKMVLGTVASESAAKLATHLADGDLAGGLDLINSAVGDGADPRQFGREVVEYLRGLLLVREGTGTRLLSATAEQSTEMEALAQRVPVEQLLRSIRLFNEAVTDLRRGLQTIPQLPLELAFVESTLEPEVPQASTPTVRQEQVLYQTSPRTASQPAAAQPKAEALQTAEQEVPTPAPTATPSQTPSNKGEDLVGKQETPALQPPAGALTLAQVEQAWPMVLHAVRQRNPATEGALRTQCKPVEVVGDEVIITFPFPFLREKLVDPGRKAEIQDALTEVLKTECRIKLVKASEYVPGPKANPTPLSSVPAKSEPAEQAPDAQLHEQAPDAQLHEQAPDAQLHEQAPDAQLHEQAPDAQLHEQAPDAQLHERAPDTQLDEQHVAQELTRWAEERGGQVKIVPPENS